MISFVIKTYNEAAHIAACLESVQAAASGTGHPFEIIVADSVSADATVAIASRYPATIVQFRNPAERGCGAGVQLGYQHSKGDLIFLLDGDMVLEPGFLPAALEALASDPQLGGVAGLMKEVAIRNTFDEQRVLSGASSTVREEPWLNGGGLYRRIAIDSAGGYAANRNLKGWEEAELGMRLRSAGWKLRRIGVTAVHHDGHALDTWALLKRHWRSHRLMANGVLLKSAFFKPWQLYTFKLLAHPLVVTIFWFLVLLNLIVINYGMSNGGFLKALALLACISLIALIVKKKSIKIAARSVAIWHINSAATIIGLFSATVPETQRIESIVLNPLHLTVENK